MYAVCLYVNVLLSVALKFIVLYFINYKGMCSITKENEYVRRYFQQHAAMCVCLCVHAYVRVCVCVCMYVWAYIWHIFIYNLFTIESTN